MKNSASEAIHGTTTDRALVIGIDVEQREYPYSVIAGVIKSEVARR
jgi:hypothetical protein